ncbi:MULTISPECIES: DUF2778 domain-containing protein [Methylobacterium]|uniref:DUF2778 domain-containing protein n=1 Tax=Methylobacterium TaxID=407 RepID=UPI0009E9F6A6|nr:MULTISPECIES: DUF2778 domain-containing protein [Methylobacterium]MCI9880842.1 DUF2778 domain-containing protein [Methylobacterium goesingense]
MIDLAKIDATTGHVTARRDPSTGEAGASARRSGIAVGGTLALAVLLGGGLAHWSRQPAPVRDDAVVAGPATTAPPDAAGVAGGPGPATQAEGEPAGLAQQGEAPAAAKETALAAIPEPSPPDAGPAPSTLAAVAEPLAPRLVPLPVPRPPEFRSGRASSRPARSAARQAPPAAAAPPEDTRSFVEKLFGIENPEPPRLAYAALETKPADDVFRRALNLVPRSGTGGVAVYDIRAKVVTLPNGEKLEAHSGLGESMDDPAHVHVRMKGPTPVGTYDITEREQPFHGVRALRLNPVGGPEAVHGRVGLLAHTYMLGASGASNGCVSFKNYEKFLQAYLRGEVQRLVVVAGG